MYLWYKLKYDIKSSSRLRTAFKVFIGHVSVLILIFCVFFFKGCSTKRPDSIKVNLVTSSSLMSAEQTIQQPRPQPQPQPRPQPKEIPRPIKQPVMQKKAVINKAIPKKTWKALDPNQIRKSTATVVNKSQPQPKINPLKASDITKNLRQINQIKFSGSYNASKSLLDYYDQVSQYLYSRWQQPSRTMGSGTPVVRVRVSVASNGRLLSSKVISKSGISAMDSSVNQLLSNLSSLPAPPDGAMEFDIYLELTN